MREPQAAEVVVMNSKLSRRTISQRKNPPHIRSSPSEAMTSAYEGTIRTFREKARYKSPFLAHQLLIFSAPARIG
jgi:hypothetical protein